MADLPNGLRGVRFYSGRPIPRGTTIRTTVMGPAVFVEGCVPGGPVVRTCAAIVENEIVLDDNLFFEHEITKRAVING